MKTFLPTTLVGSYPQPDWLIDRAKLAGRFPPRVGKPTHTSCLSRLFTVTRVQQERTSVAQHKKGVSHGVHSALRADQIGFRRRSDALMGEAFDAACKAFMTPDSPPWSKRSSPGAFDSGGQYRCGRLLVLNHDFHNHAGRCLCARLGVGKDKSESNASEPAAAVACSDTA
jgi:hypothetical protein